MQKLNVGLSAWIIQDGNYPDFETGHKYRFALEFHPIELEVRSEGPASLACIEENHYAFSGEVLHSDEQFTVLDAGLRGFCEHLAQPELAGGRWAVGLLQLNIDPFFWFEQYSRRPGAPDLFYSWKLHRILLETTPWEESVGSDERRILQRANVPRTFREVPRTNAWEDDGGYAGYILECERLKT